MTTYYKEREEEAFAKLCGILKKLSREKFLIFDIGANVGQSIDAFRKVFPDSNIVSFEPNQEIFNLLKKNWGGVDSVSLHQFAVSSKSGICKFHVTNVPEASSLLVPDPKLMKLSVENKYGFKEVNVDCITLDKFCNINKIKHIDLLKIDVQGAELEVLKGAVSLLESQSVDVIFVEVNFAETYTGQVDLKDLLFLCSTYKYYLWDISPFLYTRTGRLWYANAIFLNENVMHSHEISFQ